MSLCKYPSFKGEHHQCDQKIGNDCVADILQQKQDNGERIDQTFPESGWMNDYCEDCKAQLDTNRGRTRANLRGVDIRW